MLLLLLLGVLSPLGVLVADRDALPCWIEVRVGLPDCVPLIDSVPLALSECVPVDVEEGEMVGTAPLLLAVPVAVAVLDTDAVGVPLLVLVLLPSSTRDPLPVEVALLEGVLVGVLEGVLVGVVEGVQEGVLEGVLVGVLEGVLVGVPATVGHTGEGRHVSTLASDWHVAPLTLIAGFAVQPSTAVTG